jgi:hypothetical protein
LSSSSLDVIPGVSAADDCVALPFVPAAIADDSVAAAVFQVCALEHSGSDEDCVDSGCFSFAASLSLAAQISTGHSFLPIPAAMDDSAMVPSRSVRNLIMFGHPSSILVFGRCEELIACAVAGHVAWDPGGSIFVSPGVFGIPDLPLQLPSAVGIPGSPLQILPASAEFGLDLWRLSIFADCLSCCLVGLLRACAGIALQLHVCAVIVTIGSTTILQNCNAIGMAVTQHGGELHHVVMC